MIEGHTLVVPTYNRAELLGRLVSYYRAASPGMRILVLDSSRPEIVERNAGMLSGHADSVVHAIFPDTTPMATKLARGLDRVDTPYASFCADDDLVFLPGLHAAVEYVEQHADHVCAHGLYLNFQTAGNDVMLMREYAGPGNDASHAGARIFRLCQRYESLFYAVFRSPHLRAITRAVSELPTLHYQELLQSVAALVVGKVARIPMLYGARQSCPPAQPERDKWQTYYWFADDPTEFMAHYCTYRAAVWAFYDAHAGSPKLDRGAFERMMDLSHAVYFSAGCPPAYFFSKLQEQWPQDPFFKSTQDDLFACLRPTEAQQVARAAAGWVARLQRSWRTKRRGMARAEAEASLEALNAQIAAVCRTPWVCKLPPGLAWLPRSPEFQACYLELCRYLDRP